MQTNQINQKEEKVKVYEHHETRDEWLSCRDRHIGASEAGAILGYGFMSKMDLWKLKTGRAKPKDLSSNSAVAYGNRAEDALRQLFMAKHPEYELEYLPFDFVYQAFRPWLRATLDGELIIPETGERGILEIKTTLCMSKADWAKWNGRVPDGYLAQLAHQFLATGYSFAWLFAELTGADGNASLRSYYFTKENMADNMAFVLSEEEKFWRDVTEDRIPGAPLRI